MVSKVKSSIAGLKKKQISEYMKGQAHQDSGKRNSNFGYAGFYIQVSSSG